jgi:hypothetical protein
LIISIHSNQRQHLLEILIFNRKKESSVRRYLITLQEKHYIEKVLKMKTTIILTCMVVLLAWNSKSKRTPGVKGFSSGWHIRSTWLVGTSLESAGFRLSKGLCIFLSSFAWFWKRNSERTGKRCPSVENTNLDAWVLTWFWVSNNWKKIVS